MTMTGAPPVVWIFGKRRKRKADPQVDLQKPANLTEQREAQRAVAESAARQDQVAKQRGTVARMAESLAEVRQANHFAEGIRAAMGGEGK